MQVVESCRNRGPRPHRLYDVAYRLLNNYLLMAWWVARFECGEELEVSTTTEDKTTAWDKVKGMFPNKELVELTIEGEESTSNDLSLEQWGYRS